MAFPALNDISTAADEAELKQHFEDWLAATKFAPGAQAETELTIASGSVTATRFIHTIDTESDAAADDLTNILPGSLLDGSLVLVGIEVAGRVATLKHSAGGSGYLSLRGAQDCVLDAVAKRVLFYLDRSGGTAFLLELARFGFAQESQLEAVTEGSGSPNVLTTDEADKVVTNEGASAKAYNTLPAARAGLRSPIFVVQDADGLRVTAGAGDTLRIETSVSPAAGYVEATAIGSAVQFVAVNDTEWIAMLKLGTWTVSS